LPLGFFYAAKSKQKIYIWVPPLLSKSVEVSVCWMCPGIEYNRRFWLCIPHPPSNASGCCPLYSLLAGFGSPLPKGLRILLFPMQCLMEWHVISSGYLPRPFAPWDFSFLISWTMLVQSLSVFAHRLKTTSRTWPTCHHLLSPLSKPQITPCPDHLPEGQACSKLYLGASIDTITIVVSMLLRNVQGPEPLNHLSLWVYMLARW